MQVLTQQEKEDFMRQALVQALKAAENEEVPIGCVLVKDKKIISKSFNQRELDQKTTHHAEICAIEKANEVVKNWRLSDCAMFVTIEPCIMCAGAISLSRIPQLYFGATNPKFGGVASLYQILDDSRLNHQVQIEGDILKEECAGIIQNFFRNRR